MISICDDVLLGFINAFSECTFTKTKTTGRKKMKNMVLRATVVAWLCVQAVYGQENLCKADYTEGCAKRVICNFTDKVVREKTEFIISFRTESGAETIADCNWLRLGKFDCDPATGYTCDLQTSGDFCLNINKSETCINYGEYLFYFSHDETFSCKTAPDKVNSSSASANANPESQNGCPNGTIEKSKEPNRKKRSLDESRDPCQEGASEQEQEQEQEQEIDTWMIIGVICPCLLLGVVVVLLVKRKKLVEFVRKRKRHEQNCVKAESEKTDFENRKIFITETADSNKTDPLEEKKEFLEVIVLRPGVKYKENTNIVNIHLTEHDPAFDIRSCECASLCEAND